MPDVRQISYERPLLSGIAAAIASYITVTVGWNVVRIVVLLLLCVTYWVLRRKQNRTGNHRARLLQALTATAMLIPYSFVSLLVYSNAVRVASHRDIYSPTMVLALTCATLWLIYVRLREQMQVSSE
jgi:uncharacterized membrane protein